jgi:hypothetical protein
MASAFSEALRSKCRCTKSVHVSRVVCTGALTGRAGVSGCVGEEEEAVDGYGKCDDTVNDWKTELVSAYIASVGTTY